MDVARLVKLFIDWVIIGAVSLPILLYYLVGTPFHRGFFCEDATLRYPYHDSTVSQAVLYSIGFIVPTAVIVGVELLFSVQPYPEKRLSLGPRLSLSPAVVTSLRYFMSYLLGAAVTQLLTDLSKYSVGRLRPHFFYVCQPDWEKIDCGSPENPLYVLNYTCLGNADAFPDLLERTTKVKDAHLSFVSGHASFSFQTSMFLILYLQARVTHLHRQKGTFILPFIQFLLFAFAYFTTLSRVNDYKHHATDVLAGALLGSAVQIVNAKFVAKLFVTTHDNKELNKELASAEPETAFDNTV